MGRIDPVGRGDVQRRVERISQAVVSVALQEPSHGLDEVRRLLLEWLQEKAERPLSDAMLRGESGSLDLFGAQRVETVALDDPVFWAARQDFQDRQVARRTWITEAMLAAVDGRSALLGYRLHCVTLGEPAPFARSVPKFMRTIAQNFNVCLDGAEIDLGARHVDTQEEVEELVELLVDARRKSPVIGISMEERQGRDPAPLLSADTVANAVIGIAHVCLLSRGASFHLTDRLGKRLSVFNGAVRIWYPNLRPELDSPYDHPLWLAERLLVSEGAASKEIVEQVLRASAGRRDGDQAIPSFAEARRTASTIEREVAAKRGTSAGDLIPLYEAEHARLIEELTEAKASHGELMAIADSNFREIVSDRDEARAEVHVLRTRVDELLKVLRARDQKPEVTIPDALDELEPWAAQYLAGTVDILPRALNAAKKSVFENPSLAYNALLLLGDAYVAMRRTGSQATRERWDAGLRQLQLECSQTHSGTRAGENPDDYFVMYNGRRREIDTHLKGSSSRDPRYCFRIYFFWDDETSKVVVASLPGHLGSRIS